MPDDADSAPSFQTSLKLTDLQVRRLLDYVNARLDSACTAMGRGADGRTETGSWLDKRRLNQLWYEGDLKWREGDTYLGGVFNDSNFTRADGKRYVGHMKAKVTDDLLGTSPFFGTLKKEDAADNKNAALSKAIESFTQSGVEKSNLPETLREAVELALVRNEAVIKLRNVFEVTGYLGPADVLVNEAGQPVVTPLKQLYVLQNDDFLPVPDQPGMLVLEKDASFMVTAEQAAAFRYQQFEELPQSQVRREGLDARVLDPRDFICDPKADDIHGTDIVAHFYDEWPTVLRQLYGGFDISTQYFCAPESGEKAPIESQGEQASIAREEQWVSVAEVYLRFDADEDGKEEEILLVMDRTRNGGTALFYDYLHKHMKKRPFEVLHGLRKVPSRWYGVGIYTDKFDQLIFVDKTFNRINLKNSKTCTVTAVRRDAIEEWSDAKAPIVFGGEEVLSLNQKWNAQSGDWLQQVRLVELSEEEMELQRTMVQVMDQEFGYLSAADASASGLEQSNTATGVASIERSGNNIVKAVERVHAGGITRILEQAVDILLENMDPTRLAIGPNAELLTLNRDEIRDLPREVKLFLTRSRSSELLATNAQALAIANQYFDLIKLDPRRAKALRPMYLAQLKALEVQDADDILPEVTDEIISAWQTAQQPSKEPPKQSISIPYKDLLPSEKAQVLQGIGIKPGSVDELPPPLPVEPTAEGQE